MLFTRYLAVGNLCQVALVNGISMGGGASLMVPLRFSVVTEKTVSSFMILSMIIVLICSFSNAIYLFIYSGPVISTFMPCSNVYHRFLPLQKQVLGITLIVGSHTCYPIFPGIWVSISYHQVTATTLYLILLLKLKSYPPSLILK